MRIRAIQRSILRARGDKPARNGRTGTRATNRVSKGKKHPGKVPWLIVQKGMQWRRDNLCFVNTGE